MRLNQTRVLWLQKTPFEFNLGTTGVEIQTSLEFKLADLWLGLFYNTFKSEDNNTGLAVWMCLIPCFPIHIYVNIYKGQTDGEK